MTKAELFSRLICALTHDMYVCDECKKCGKDAADCRMNLIKELAKAFKRQVPWKETENDD